MVPRYRRDGSLWLNTGQIGTTYDNEEG